MKNCKWCQKEILSTNKKKVFCNDQCKNRYGANKLKERRKNTKHYCIVCGKTIENYISNTKFCDEMCRNKHLINNHNELFKNAECCGCEIGGWKAKALTQHLSVIHNITLNDYMVKYSKTLDECVLKSSREMWGSKIKGENNGAYQHGGKYSPYSKKFVKYENLTEEEKDNKINDMYVSLSNTLTDGTGRIPTQIEYWAKQGYTEDESIDIISKRQTTFSLDICVKKHGEMEGKRIWKERQNKWLSNLPKQNFSFISQDLFWVLYNKTKNKYKHIYFAQLNQDTKQIEENRNFEYKVDIGQSYCKLDFFIKDINKAIEFDGDYWHGEKRGNKERDETRTRLIESTGIKVLHVKERDFNNDRQKVVQECIDFIYNT